MSERQHGTVAKRQVEGCRCRPCIDAYNDWASNRRRQQAYGRWEPYVDAAPVRAHVEQLIAGGINWRRVAKLAGIGTGTVEKLLYGQPRLNRGPSKRLRPESARKLLAVQVSQHKVLMTDATGFRRRMQALVCKGWSLHRLAEELGCDRRTLQQAMTGDQVRAATDQAGHAAYDRLWRLEPTDHGISANAAAITRGWAKRRGWAPVGCWDDDTIDDPAAVPDWTGHCGTLNGYQKHYDLGVTPACEPCKAARRANYVAQQAAKSAA